MKGPGGEISVVITADTDLTAVATVMHGVLFPAKRALSDPDDLAL
jgi:hypothetical protein